MSVEELNEERKKQNLSIEELAARSHLPKSTVEKVIFGITKDPRRSTIEAIEKALGLNSGYRETMPMEITPLEEELLITFRRMSDEDKQLVLILLKKLTK